MEGLFLHPQVVAFLVSYGAGVAWDATKASTKGMAGLFRRTDGPAIAKMFEGLRQQDQLRRSCEHLINEVLKPLPGEQKKQAASDADLLAELVCGFLTEPQAGKPPITEQLRVAILEHVELPNGADDAAIASITAAVVLAIARDDLAEAILLGAVEQVQSTVTTVFETQSAQAAASNILMSMLFTGQEDIKQRLGSSFSPGVPDAEAVAKHLANQLSDTTALLKHIGIQLPDASYVDTKAACAPPELPQGHVKRDAVCKQIERRLEQHPILAVTGYPECGKTLALAEFASRAQECFWLDFPASLSSDVQAMQLLDFALSAYFESGSFVSNEIMAALKDRLAETPLLIVLDNAERLGNVNLLQPLLAVAEAANGRLRILIAYADTPEFTAAAKLKRVPTWRLSGMERHEAVELYETSGIDITKPRLNATTVLCVKYEGHVGMLRLYRDDIAKIQDDADVARVLADTPSKTTAVDFLDALLLRFMKSLSPDELTLCRRLSIAVMPFRKCLAAALWGDAGDRSIFPVVWAQCTSGVFERVTEDRFRLPYLYCTSLCRDVDPDEARKLHQAAAAVLFMPPDRAMTLDDAFSCVSHHIRAGQPEAAVHAAMALLTSAMTADRVDVLRVLSSRFALVISEDLLGRDVSAQSRVGWHTLSGAVAHRCGDIADIEACVQNLCAVLDEHKVGSVSDDAIRLGWIGALIFAAASGTPELAWRAFDGLLPGFMLDVEDEETGSPLVPLSCAYINSSRNATDFILNVFRRAESGSLSSKQIWDDGRCWEVWRGVGAELYGVLDHLHSTDADEAHVRADAIWQNVEKWLSEGCREVAVILGAAAVVIDIDVFRDMKRAVSRARILSENADSLSARVRGLALTTLGDALRCAEDVGPAEIAYRDALAAWPTDDSVDRARTQNSLAVTVARLDRPEEGLWLGRLAAREMCRGAQDYQAATLALIHLECAVMAIHGGRLPQALVSLVRAHRVLRPCRPNYREWPVLAQVAMNIERAAEPDAKLEEMPVPGFTYGLPSAIPWAKEILPSVPDVKVARACAALRFRRKALHYFGLAYEEIADETLRGMVAVMMHGPARLCRDLKATVQSAVRIFCAPSSSIPTELGPEREQFLLGVVDSTVYLATELAGEEGAVSELEAAQQIVRSCEAGDQAHVAAVEAAIVGLLEGLCSGKDQALANAYRRAVDLKAYNAARNLAWYWCFRFLTGRRASTRDVFTWQWRVAWLTRLTASNDSQFMTGSLEQQRTFWSGMRSEGNEASIDRIQSAITQSVTSVLETWRDLESELARCAFEALGYSGFPPELPPILASDIDIPWLDGIREKCTSQLLDTILSPVAPEFSEKIDSTLEFIRKIMEPVDGVVSEAASCWLAEVGHLSAIHNRVQQGGLDEQGAQDLLALSAYRPSLSSHSGANWLVALAQVVQSTDARDSSFLDKAIPLLSSTVIGDFIEAADDLPASFEVRLRLLGLKTDSQCILRDFHEALTSVVIQQSAAVPITRRAAAAAGIQLASARERGEELARAFGDLTNDAEELGEGDADVIWACLYSRAQLRMALLLPALRYHLGDPTETAERLQSVERDMLDALEFFEERGDHRGAAFAAAELATKACVLGEGEKESEYCDAAIRHAKESGDPKLVQTIQRQLDVRKQLAEPQHQAQGHRILPEEDIAAYVEATMRAYGWPEDRRRHVEDDVRKLNQAAIANRDFCKHLQPLQNLTHAQSPVTVYTRPTMYTCSCTQLGHETRIECDDMEVVIKAMRQSYCEDCTQRDPGEIPSD